MRRALPVALLAVALAALVGCSPVSAPTATPIDPTDVAPIEDDHADDFVTVDGTSFELGAEPFRFVGVNIYDAAASDRYSCRVDTRMSDATLRTTLRTLHDEAGATVLRFWAYQTYTQGATYWDGVDRVLAAARAAGMKVIPVLEDGPGNCTNTTTAVPKAAYEGDSWYSNGYRSTYGNASMSYRDYVREITEHYADDPTILGWSMINEADTSARTSDDQTVLIGFATDIAEVIRSVDTRHLLTVGTQGNGAPGASGRDFSDLYALDAISFAEVHDWGYWGSDTEAMPGGDGASPPPADSDACARLDASIGCSFARAADLGKPLLVGEAGMRGVTESERIDRAARLRAKMDAAFDAGASGYLIWSVTTADTDGYDLRLDRRDPLLPQLAEVAADLRRDGTAP